MGQIAAKEEFTGVWYDLAGYPDQPYTRAQITITETGALNMKKYDEEDNLMQEQIGTASLGKSKLTISLVDSKGTYTDAFNLLYVGSLAILENAEGARILSRNRFLDKEDLYFLREKMESLGLEFGRVSLDTRVLR